MTHKWCAALGCAALLLAARAVPAADALESFLDRTHSLSAHFDQEVRDMDGLVLQRSSGEMVLEQPNRFRWDYETPAVQLVVSDGKSLWLYDPELEQVTVKPLDQLLANTPALLLGVDLPALKKDFEVQPVSTEDGIEWYELVPRRADATFRQVLLGFREGELVRMELFDHLGQSTRLDFGQVKVNPAVPAAKFSFTPPPGVDVIGAGQ